MRSEFGDVVSRIDRAVLLAPADVAIGQEQPGLARIVDLGDAEVALGAAAGLLRAEVEQAIVRSVVDPRRSAFQQEADRIVALLSCSATRHAAQAMIRRFAPTDCAGRPDWDAIEPLEAQYANVDVPVLILWGRRDETLPCAMGYKLERQIPGARLEIIERAKHSSHQERAPEAARRILSFVDGSPE